MSALAERRQARQWDEVWRRHGRAMRVVRQVPDEDARLILLNYVVHGSDRIEQALAIAPPPYATQPIFMLAA